MHVSTAGLHRYTSVTVYRVLGLTLYGQPLGPLLLRALERRPLPDADHRLFVVVLERVELAHAQPERARRLAVPARPVLMLMDKTRER